MRPLKHLGRLLLAIVGIVVVLALITGGIMLWAGYNKAPLPIADRCVAEAGGNTTTVDPEQAHYAALIAGMSIKRGLVPRAASIALATAYQESGIRNLDYGHSDSLGLFQQRPSKGWGTVEEIMDPWYSTREFYRAMERIDDWQTKDINDVAQAVQRSAYPEAYRRHETNARTLASSLTGETPASFRCQIAEPAPADADGMRSFLIKTLGEKKITVKTTETGMRVTADNATIAWSVAQLAVANVAKHGVASVQVGGYGWTHSSGSMAEWEGTGPQTGKEVVIQLLLPTPSR